MTRPGRLRIALVTETYPPEVNGVAMTLGRLADGLAAGGHRMSIVRPRQAQEAAGHTPENHLLTPGLPIPRYPELRFGLPSVRRLLQAWRTRRPDIVHIATEGPLGFSALIAARRLDIPVVSTFHTNFHSYSRHYGIGWLQGSIERYLRWFHNRTATTLVPTPELAEQLACRGFRNVGVLSRGVDTRLFHPGRRSAELRKSWGAGEHDSVVIIVGRMAPEKNLDLALRAFSAIRRLHPNARMVCVGDGPLRETLCRQHPECLFVGTKRGEALAEHYASADLFVFPSLTETFGNVVSEALASGLPVVAFDYAAASDLIVTGENGRSVPPGDASAFIDAAVELVPARHLLADRRTRCTSSVQHLDWSLIHDRYVNLLHETILHHPAHQEDRTVFRCVPD
ncbi:MAG: glycosyltransferase family 1 protein [Rhodocyclaceae bacterium]|jgi:glycosyltransferase involved in cell wall biosynthesis|nr:glycosyltransferase family 1 protein [Rhodocyclaceae bacterium]